MKDFEAYFEKRDEFVAAAKGTTSATLKELLVKNTFFTDLCISLLTEFADAVIVGLEDIKRKEQKFNELRQQSQANVEKLNKLAASNSELDKFIDEGSKLVDQPENEELLKELGLRPTKQIFDETFALLKSTAQQRVDLLEQVKKVNQHADELMTLTILAQNFFVQLEIDRVQNSLFKEVFKGQDSAGISSALVKILNYFLGFTPLSIPLSTLQLIADLKAIYEARLKAIKTTDNYLKYLETYTLTASNWALTTQVVIDTIRSFAQVQPLSLELSQARINEKINLLSSKWSLETPMLKRD